MTKRSFPFPCMDDCKSFHSNSLCFLVMSALVALCLHIPLKFVTKNVLVLVLAKRNIVKIDPYSIAKVCTPDLSHFFLAW